MSHLPSPNQPRTNFLVDLIPATQRKRAYAVHGLVGFLIGALFLAVAAIQQGLPPNWLIIAVVVYNFSSPFFNALATANTVPTGGEAVEEGFHTS